MSTSFFSSPFTLGILGGGQLGKMLLQTTLRWDIKTKVLDPDSQAPARLACNQFVQGSLMDYETVYAFGQDCDIVTIEIEHVNTRALKQLKSEGKIVHPDPDALEIIQDKGLQKLFYSAHQLPTSNFTLYEHKADILQAIEKGHLDFPFVQKSRTGGYDGKGVSVINTQEDLKSLMDTPCVVEDLIQIQMEIAVLGARNESGEMACFDAVSMEFLQNANLLDLLVFPAPLASPILEQAQEITRKLMSEMNICGLLAVEFFLDRENKLFINEIAPRPHNSGHQTIESTDCSQYEQHIRGILNLPLGSCRVHTPSVMINLLGDPDANGPVYYDGIQQCLKSPGVHIHLYGKSITKPFRKMGHVTVTNSNPEQAKQIAQWVKQTLIVRSR